jgi:hypothetical protein
MARASRRAEPPPDIFNRMERQLPAKHLPASRNVVMNDKLHGRLVDAHPARRPHCN